MYCSCHSLIQARLHRALHYADHSDVLGSKLGRHQTVAGTDDRLCVCLARNSVSYHRIDDRSAIRIRHAATARNHWAIFCFLRAHQETHRTRRLNPLHQQST